MSWTLVLEPLLPEWACKGDENSLGLNEGPNEPLVIVCLVVHWDEVQDDDLAKMTTRRAIEKMDEIANTNGTGHRYRFMNYCATWQKPFEGYGDENLKFLREVSRNYDPEGLFQKGFFGGFKLEVIEDES